jgi:hypothetical protein
VEKEFSEVEEVRWTRLKKSGIDTVKEAIYPSPIS